MKKKKKGFIYRLRGFRLFCLSVLSVMLLLSSAYAWRSMEDKTRAFLNVTAQGCDVTVCLATDNDILRSFSGSQIDVCFEDFFCGQLGCRSLTLECTNNLSTPTALTWLFRAPLAAIGEELPYRDDAGRYYYLGSQLKVTSITATKNAIALDISEHIAPNGSFLVPTTSEGDGQVNYIENEIDEIPELILIDGLILEGYTTISITLQFTFIDNQTDQSVYQAPFQGCCSRRLALELRRVD